MACGLLACDDNYKENDQPRLNTVLVSSMAMSDAFKNSYDSLTRVLSQNWQFYGIKLTFDSSSPINNLIAQELISDDAICAQKLNVRRCSFHGYKSSKNSSRNRDTTSPNGIDALRMDQ
ncbi:hypothetical protein F8M41_014083 [Gigaspora margarita]|uniref:Uncharacterized protein n=1 Tax=Gigaspora margarita TaxID=4874 RepID=A0A8H3WXJ1_GIGMA|nr:hypothetical protein F8M41_014083 [Gigaspora margarita]